MFLWIPCSFHLLWQQHAMPKKNKKLSCMEYAIYYLSRYPKTTFELNIKLMEKGYNEFQRGKTIEFLEENDYLNDQKFAESYLYSEVTKKGKPLFMVRQKLSHKGIDKSIIEKICNEQEEELQKWMDAKLNKQIDLFKKKWIEGIDLVQKLMRRWYNIKDIQRIAKHRKREKEE